MIRSKLSSLIFALAVVFFYLPSHAFFVEPILGYSLQSIEDGTGDDDSHSGVYFGGRLGAGIPIVPFLWAAADVGITTGGTYTSKPSDAESDADRLAAGLTVGIDIPLVPIIDRVWVGYSFIDNLSFDNSDANGSSFKLGLGLKFIPFVSFNLEYILGNYDESDVDGVGTTDIDQDTSTFLLSVSVPLP